MTNNYGIGLNNKLPWKLKKDMDFFKKITIGNNNNSVIMGSNTFKSIKKPLVNRYNIILSKSNKYENNNSINYENNNPVSYENVNEIFKDEKYKKSDEIFIIGGKQIFDLFINDYKYCDNIYITNIYSDIKSDVFISENMRNIINQKYKLECNSELYFENDLYFDFNKYKLVKNDFYFFNENSNHEENQYLNLIKKIIKNNKQKQDRTKVGTLSIFGEKMEFDISKSFPLFTTKKVFFKGIVEELMWFIKGQTDSNILKNKGVGIWDLNSTREFLDSVGLYNRNPGDLGPVYGFQWRHFGAKYFDAYTDYSNKGFDQLNYVINEIINNPNSRRIIMSAWNPIDLKHMALPPCHVLCQFIVENGKLNCILYQRSCDIGLGVPFNIASYSLLTYIIGIMTNYKPGKFIYMMGDVHIYKNHVDSLLKQCMNKPYEFPTLKIDLTNKKNNEKIEILTLENIHKLSYENFILENYKFHQKIKMQMN